jgi:hypothetical protein
MPEALPCPCWTPPILAQALQTLLPEAISAAQVRDRAIALGLVRHSHVDPGPELTARAVARLLLAGYQLPATVESGTFASLTDHHRAGRRVFVIVAEPTPELLQVRAVAEVPPDTLLTLAEPEAPALRCWPLERFRAAWARSGNSLLVAATSWQELPTTGLLFFGGLCDADGAYHWNTAECDTDERGRILRY